MVGLFPIAIGVIHNFVGLEPTSNNGRHVKISRVAKGDVSQLAKEIPRRKSFCSLALFEIVLDLEKEIFALARVC